MASSKSLLIVPYQPSLALDEDDALDLIIRRSQSPADSQSVPSLLAVHPAFSSFVANSWRLSAELIRWTACRYQRVAPAPPIPHPHIGGLVPHVRLDPRLGHARLFEPHRERAPLISRPHRRHWPLATASSYILGCAESSFPAARMALDQRSTDYSGLVGRNIAGGLRVTQRTGSTSQGSLYEAEDLEGRQVVLLILPPGGPGQEPAGARSFKLATRIRHPNVAAVQAVGDLEDGSAYVVLEQLVGSRSGIS